MNYTNYIPSMIIALLLFGAVITGTFTLLANFIPASDTAEYAKYNTTFNKLSTIRANSDNLGENVKNAKPDEGILGFINGLVKTGWSAITQTWTSLTTMTGLITDLNVISVFPIPSWFTGVLVSIIIIIIAFGIVLAFLKLT